MWCHKNDLEKRTSKLRIIISYKIIVLLTFSVKLAFKALATENYSITKFLKLADLEHYSVLKRCIMGNRSSSLATETTKYSLNTDIL